jgi:hypothetical protein
MSIKCAFRLTAIMACNFGWCVAVDAQLAVPTITNQINTYAPPRNISTMTQNFAAQQMNRGFAGARSSANSAPMMRSAVGGGARLGLGVNGARGSKPFTSYNSAPTVSPYLNLFRTDLNTGSNFNYSTLVEPQLQQQQVNQQLQRAAVQQNRRLTSIAAQSDYNPEGAKDQYPTGHQTVFNYHGHYYPAAQARPKQQRQ